MRIHTDTHTYQTIFAALKAVQDAGLVAKHVDFGIIDKHGSRKRNRAFEVQLETYTKVKGDKRSYKNSGSYGAGDAYAATYDEWGFFLAALYLTDGNLFCDYHFDRAQFVKNTARKMNSRQVCFNYMTPARKALKAAEIKTRRAITPPERYSVFLWGRIARTFRTEAEARQWVNGLQPYTANHATIKTHP